MRISHHGSADLAREEREDWMKPIARKLVSTLELATFHSFFVQEAFTTPRKGVSHGTPS